MFNVKVRFVYYLLAILPIAAIYLTGSFQALANHKDALETKYSVIMPTRSSSHIY
jgi:hypothetical protein